MPLLRRSTAEALGTAFLLAMVVGSGIMAERLSNGNVALALLANAIATGTGLFTLIMVFAGVSGAHFNPAVSLAMALRGNLAAGDTFCYVAAQAAGAVLGVVAAHAMFDLPLISMSGQVREGAALVWSEFVATFGLVLVVFGASRRGVLATALSVGAYITAAYWFTASTSFANPAVSIARAFTDSFSGIRISNVPWFIGSQFAAAVVACVVGHWLFAGGPRESRRPSSAGTG